jgi:tRNA-(ms[2]io[6]A)-hydroxylase
MLLFRAQAPADWIHRVIDHLPTILIDHAILERKAATSAINLEKYPQLAHRLDELNAIAIEELQHFQLVLDLLKRRGIPFRSLSQSPWISGLMRRIRKGSREQVIDHLICMALIEGRSCEKFQQLRDALATRDPELSKFYGGLVESEGHHYATFWLMAREVDEAEADRRLDFYLDLDAELIVAPGPEPRLH